MLSKNKGYVFYVDAGVQNILFLYYYWGWASWCTWLLQGVKISISTDRNVSKLYYLTFCTFSVEFKESSLSDTRCMIQDVVLPHCGDKRMTRRCTRSSLPNYFIMTSYHWNAGKIRQCKQRKQS